MNCRWIIRFVFFLSVALVSAIACEDPAASVEEDPNARHLLLQLYAPGGRPDAATKSGTETSGIVATDQESKLYDVRVWAYEHKPDGEGDDDLPVSFNVMTGLNNGNGWKNTGNLPGSGYYGSTYWVDANTLQIDMRIPGKVLDWPESRMKVDFYIVANSPSLHLLTPTGTDPFTTSPFDEDPYTISRGTLKNLVFGKTTRSGSIIDDFGTENPVTSVPSGVGLPFTGFYNLDKNGQPNGVDISFLKSIGSLTPQQAQAQMYERIPIIQLSRSISRVRLVFSRLKDMEYVRIDGIRITCADDNLTGIVPDFSYLFPQGTVTSPNPNANYGSISLEGLLFTDIPPVRHPEQLRSDNTERFADQQTYEAFLNNDLVKTSGKETAQRFCYFRETDRPLAVIIDYTFIREAEEEGEEDYEEHHSIVVPVQGGTEFPRNHSATLYAYFLEDAIHFSAYADPWDDEDITHTNLTPQIE